MEELIFIKCFFYFKTMSSVPYVFVSRKIISYGRSRFTGFPWCSCCMQAFRALSNLENWHKRKIFGMFTKICRFLSTNPL